MAGEDAIAYAERKVREMDEQIDRVPHTGAPYVVRHLSGAIGELEKALKEERASRVALIERVRALLMFCNDDGSPVDGFRFREEVCALRDAIKEV
jgi:hypothetical protein